MRNTYIGYVWVAVHINRPSGNLNFCIDLSNTVDSKIPTVLALDIENKALLEAVFIRIKEILSL